nr:zinc finger, CCHC-type [Tanacetum cinerariifolium]
MFKYEPLLQEGHGVAKNGKRLSLLPNMWKISFYKGIEVTIIEQVNGNFIGFVNEPFTCLLDTNNEYHEHDCVAIGNIVPVNGYGCSKIRRTIVIEDAKSLRLECIFWDNWALMWNEKRHVGEEKVQQARLQSLMIGFNTLQMKDDDTVDAFTAKLNGYATKAKELRKTLDESLLVRKLLDSTPDRFIQIVASIEQTSDLDGITLDEITGKLKAFEERIKLRKGGQDESQENLLFAQGEHSGKGRRFSKRGGRSNSSRGNWRNNRN